MTGLPQFALGYIRAHVMIAEFAESLLRLQSYDFVNWRCLCGRIVPHHCGLYLNHGRNEWLKKVLRDHAETCPVVVSVDTDNLFTPEQVFHLVSLCTDEHPIVSALYFICDQYGKQHRPLLVKRRPDDSFETIWEYQADTLVPSDVVGMGFCAMRTKLLMEYGEKHGGTWFDFDKTKAGTFLPEDTAFSFRMKDLMGVQPMVHTGIIVGHMKYVDVREPKKAQPNNGRSIPAR